MKKKLTTRQEYDGRKATVEALIAEATEKGMLEPEIANFGIICTINPLR